MQKTEDENSHRLASKKTCKPQPKGTESLNRLLWTILVSAAGSSRRIAVVHDNYSEGAVIVHLPNKLHNIYHVQIFSQKDTK